MMTMMMMMGNKTLSSVGSSPFGDQEPRDGSIFWVEPASCSPLFVCIYICDYICHCYASRPDRSKAFCVTCGYIYIYRERETRCVGKVRISGVPEETITGLLMRKRDFHELVGVHAFRTMRLG